MHDRAEWTRGKTGEHKIKDKTYRNLTEFTRKCAKCGVPFSIFVTEKIATCDADSNSFGLKNCELHRRGSVPHIDETELNQLRMANQVMKEELAGLYVRLARYELQPAMTRLGIETTTPFPWTTQK